MTSKLRASVRLFAGSNSVSSEGVRFGQLLTSQGREYLAGVADRGLFVDTQASCYLGSVTFVIWRCSKGLRSIKMAPIKFDVRGREWCSNRPSARSEPHNKRPSLASVL